VCVCATTEEVTISTKHGLLAKAHMRTKNIIQNGIYTYMLYMFCVCGPLLTKSLYLVDTKHGLLAKVPLSFEFVSATLCNTVHHCATLSNTLTLQYSAILHNSLQHTLHRAYWRKYLCSTNWKVFIGIFSCACFVVCCRVLRSGVECCRVLQSVTECCRVLQSVAECCRVL